MLIVTPFFSIKGCLLLSGFYRVCCFFFVSKKKSRIETGFLKRPLVPQPFRVKFKSEVNVRF